MLLTDSLPAGLLSLFHIQPSQLGDVTAHGGLDPPKSIGNQESAQEIHSQASLIESAPQLRVLLLRSKYV